MIHRDIIIIGGGAAGLFAAAQAAGKGRRVTVLEKMERCGRKLGITGKGRCNLTNTKPWEEFAGHVHPKNIFFKNAFFGMSNSKTMEFFERTGLPLTVERGDRVFPRSMRAADVADTLVSYIMRNGGEIITGCRVERIQHRFLCKDRMVNAKENGGKENSSPGAESGGPEENIPAALETGMEVPPGVFEIYREGEKKPFAVSSRLLIATGGLSYPATGSSGDGYRFARELGHTVSRCFPSLTALKPAGYGAEFYGISLRNVEVRLRTGGNTAAAEFGDLDFTGGGIEGPIGLRVSRRAVFSLLNGDKVELVLDLKPAVSIEQLKGRIGRELQKLEANPVPGIKKLSRREQEEKKLRFLLVLLMPKALIRPFMRSHPDLTAENLPEKLKHWIFPIESYVGYERAVVTAGGVSLEEISRKTMESKLIKGLYFSGEILDLDGDTGGYNLQIAFSTASLAIENALCSLEARR